MTAPVRFGEFWSLRHAAGGSPVTQAISQRLGAVCAWAAGSMGMTPAGVTLAGAAVFCLAAWLYAILPAGLWPTLALLALMQLGYALDCADGQLARATGRAGPFGAWLDVACDYLRNAALAMSVAFHLFSSGVGAPAAFGAALLLLAGTAVKLHTVTVLRGGTAISAGVGATHQGLRRIALAMLDTSTHLFLLALLRDWPSLLAIYTSAAGTAYGVLAVLQARRRLASTAS